MPRTTRQSKSNNEDSEDEVLRLQKRAKELEENAEVRYRVAFAERPRQLKSKAYKVAKVKANAKVEAVAKIKAAAKAEAVAKVKANAKAEAAAKAGLGLS